MRRCLAVVGMLEQVGPSAAPGYAATPWSLTRQYLVVCERRYRGVPPWLFGLGLVASASARIRIGALLLDVGMLDL